MPVVLRKPRATMWNAVYFGAMNCQGTSVILRQLDWHIRLTNGCPESVVGRGADRALAAWGAGVRPCHIGLDPGLVDEDEVLRPQVWLALAPRRPRGRDVWPVLLGSMKRLFLRVSPMADR